MSSIINAGTSGITITGSSSTVLSLATNGTNRVTIDTSGNLSVASGNLTFSGTGQRITGDMSNATPTSRLAFQSSTTNGNTVVQFIPNGTATQTNLLLYANTDLSNSAALNIFQNATESTIRAILLGTGSYTPLTFQVGGSERFRIGTSGQFGIGGENYGTTGQVLTSNGSGSAPSWQTAGGSSLKSQTFNSSGTFTVPTGVTSVWVTMTGGGGAGGSSISGSGAPSGASGAYTIKQAVSVTAGASITVTIGGGGAGVAAGVGASTSGGRGGTTSFGSVSVTGGYGGQFTGTNLQSYGVGGANGGAGFGYNPARLPGSVGGTPGATGAFLSNNPAVWGGAGGLFGDGTDGNATAASTSAAANTGAGAGGANSGGATTFASGNGGSGRVIVEWLG